VLRAEKQNEIPSTYIMKRWGKNVKGEFDLYGYLFDLYGYSVDQNLDLLLILQRSVF
jgi:hypothetical protein